LLLWGEKLLCVWGESALGRICSGVESCSGENLLWGSKLALGKFQQFENCPEQVFYFNHEK